MADSDSAQLPLALTTSPKPTGDLWRPDAKHPATVPLPLPVVVVRIEGPFTALDNKLWVALVKEAWPNLDKPGHIHEVSIPQLVTLFRRVSGRHDLGATGELQVAKKTQEETGAALLWQSVRRLCKTTIEWEDEQYMGINSLLGARMDREVRASGKLYYTFDPLLAQHVLLPSAWARLNVHLVMKLRSKYAVRLYEILESYVNRRDSSYTVAIETLQDALKVPENAYPDWRELKKRVIGPAVDEINRYCEEAGFIVSYQGVREGKAYSKIKFTVTKTAARDDRDTMLQGKSRRARTFDATPVEEGRAYEPTDAVLDQMRDLAPGWDRQALLARYREWSKGKVPARNPHGAFLGWVKRFTKKKAAA
jgi:hypothetical protein